MDPERQSLCVPVELEPQQPRSRNTASETARNARLSIDQPDTRCSYWTDTNSVQLAFWDFGFGLWKDGGRNKAVAELTTLSGRPVNSRG